MPSIVQRMTAWLCLAVVLLAGVLPAQGFVLCIEADGCVEVKSSDASCDGCYGHEVEAAPSAVLASAAQDAPCPCIDLAVPGTSQDRRVLPKPIGFQIGPCLAPRLEVLGGTFGVGAGPPRSPPATAPRPPESLALIRTVVLLE